MKEKNYEGQEGFTLALALVDAIPVLCFGGSAVIVGLLFQSPVFIVGAALTFLGGASKVLWKILLAATKRDRSFFNKAFRCLMAGGFALMLLSVVLGYRRISFAAILAAVTGLPSVIFFAVGAVGMCTMGVLAGTLDSTKARSNWIEQCVNATAQLSFLVGLLLLL